VRLAAPQIESTISARFHPLKRWPAPVSDRAGYRASSACNGSARYNSARYGVLYKRARRLARLGLLASSS
jgi:hypothetical protein